MKKLIVASSNRGKLKEIAEILGDRYEIVSMAEAGFHEDVEETGTTFYENALLKASAVSEALGCDALADDSGLCVDALDGAPGVYSARYAGEAHNDKANRQLLLKNLEGVQNRRAHFATVITICYPNGDFITAKGRVEGSILREERGTEGFGYDSLFFSDELQKTFAEASADEKNSVSHRGRALHAMLEKLNSKN